MTIQQLKYKCTCEMNDDIEQIINDLSSSKPDAVENAQKLLTELQQINPNIKKLQDAINDAQAKAKAATSTGAISTAQPVSAATQVTQVTAAGLLENEIEELNKIQLGTPIIPSQIAPLQAIAAKLKGLQKDELNEIIKSTDPITQPQIDKLKNIIATNPSKAGGRRKKHKSRKNRKLKKYKSKKRR